MITLEHLQEIEAIASLPKSNVLYKDGVLIVFCPEINSADSVWLSRYLLPGDMGLEIRVGDRLDSNLYAISQGWEHE